MSDLLEGTQMNGGTKPVTVPWSQHTKDRLDLLQYRFEHQHDRKTLGTGLPSIDSIIGRFDPGHLVMIKGPVEVDKSAFALGIVNWSTVENKVPGLILSLQLSRYEWFDRLFALRSGVDTHRFSKERFLESDFPKIIAQIKAIKEAPIYCEDKDCYRIEDIFNRMSHYKCEADIQYVVLDHANLVQSQHETMTGTLKMFAKQLGITLFVVFHTGSIRSKTIDRANIDKEIHITVPGEQLACETCIRYVCVELNQHGRTGGVKAFFDDSTLAFRERELEDERKKILKTMPYAEYLQTPEWAAIRSSKLKESGFRCQLCNKQGKLDVHHRTYERRGCELLSDLIALCEECHDAFHKNSQVEGAYGPANQAGVKVRTDVF